MTERTEHLADQNDERRSSRERRTALAAAFHQAARSDTPVSPALAALIRSRIDGTEIPTTTKENDQ